LNEEGVGIVPFRQQDAASSDTMHAKTMSQLLRGLLSALFVIHVEGEIDRAWPFRQLLELLRVKMRALFQRIVFPLRQGEHIVNLYGRSVGSAFAHRFLPGTKGGLYAWEKVRQSSEVILVEGLFDYAVLRQAGFQNVTCSLGTHLNRDQFLQLCDGTRTVYLTFDVDANRSGQHAAEQLTHRLYAKGIVARRVMLPEGHDPNSFFVQGGDAREFQSLLEVAQP
jgi:DNA primase